MSEKKTVENKTKKRESGIRRDFNNKDSLNKDFEDFEAFEGSDSNNVASAMDYTGSIPIPPKNDEEAESYQEIYDTPSQEISKSVSKRKNKDTDL